MAWLYLFLAGLLEAIWAFSLKQSVGFTRLNPSLVTIVAMAGSVFLLAIAMKSLPLGTAYAIWTGIGALSAFLIGIVVLGEDAGALRVASAALILIGLVGLRLASGPE